MTGRVVDADMFPTPIEAFVRVADGTPWKEAGIPGIPARVAQDIRGYYETVAVGLTDHVAISVGGDPVVLRADRRPAASLLAARAAMRDAGEKQAIWFYMAPGDR